MNLELWQAGVMATAGTLGGGGLVRLLTVRPERRRIAAEADEHRENSAVALSKAYGELIDRFEAEVARQGAELGSLREQVTGLLTLVGARDQELATLRTDLTTERSENTRLRARVEQLEQQVNSLPRRRDDPAARRA